MDWTVTSLCCLASPTSPQQLAITSHSRKSIYTLRTTFCATPNMIIEGRIITVILLLLVVVEPPVAFIIGRLSLSSSWCEGLRGRPGRQNALPYYTKTKFKEYMESPNSVRKICPFSRIWPVSGDYPRNWYYLDWADLDLRQAVSVWKSDTDRISFSSKGRVSFT